MDEKAVAAVERIRSWDDLLSLERNISNRGLLTDAVNEAVRQKSTELGRVYVIDHAQIDANDLTGAEDKVLDVVGEYWALQKRSGKPISRTISQIINRGLTGAAEASVCRRSPTLGYDNLLHAGLEELSFERIVLDYPDEFSPRAIWFARRTLGIPNSTDKPPPTSDAEIHSKTSLLIEWIKSRIDPESGRIAAFTNAEAAGSLGMQDLRRNGRAYGNVQSRIDFACYKAAVPPLGLTAVAPFSKAWSATGCDWDFPIAAMQDVAQARQWSQEDFERISREAESLPGQAWFVWQEALTNNEESVRDWAFGLTSRVPNTEVVSGADWSDEELIAAVTSYLEMLGHVRAGTPFVKRQIYQDLADRFGRSPKAFEYRMQNISYVMSLMGRRWVPGLVPAQNVGANVADKIERILAEMEGRASDPAAVLKIEVAEARKRLRKAPLKPAGNKSPAQSISTVTRYARDGSVIAWVLEQASGICECCQEPAPFESANGPFLEVHHVRHLADNGSDTIFNAVALCPNCHRRLHYSIDAEQMVDRLFLNVQRLIKEH